MKYDIIIAGGGPVGIALGIELGLQQIKTLILEKHAEPLHTPRAQSLSARSMEFFMRWGIDKTLEDRILLPKNLPQTGIWCSSLSGKTLFEGAWGDNQLDENTSPKEGVRIPLWVTEDVLRKRLADFSCVNFLKQHEVQESYLQGEEVIVHAYDKVNNITTTHRSSYLACCDGVVGFSKKQFNNSYSKLSDETKMLGMLFISKEMMTKKTVSDGIMYFVLADGAMAFVGPIDLNQGLWLAQVIWNDPTLEPNESLLSDIIDKIMGAPIDKSIVDHYFWNMQVQLADFFSLHQRIFWLGDAAHAFAPTGGLGLNTGFGDAQNIGWKLAAVIRNEAPSALLSTYEIERRPICLNNLTFAKNNSEEFVEVKKKFPPEKDFLAYATAYANLGNRYLCSSGLTLGYSYLSSPLTQVPPASQLPTTDSPFKYTPKSEPGYFLPHVMHQGSPIYTALSATRWNLIVCGQDKMQDNDREQFLTLLAISLSKEFEASDPMNNSQNTSSQRQFLLPELKIIEVEHNIYPYAYLLIRPDWHISKVGNHLETILS